MEKRIPGTPARGHGLDHPELMRLIDASLSFTYEFGDVTPVQAPHDTGWRTLPYLVTACGDARGTLEVAGKGLLAGRPGHAICVAPGIRHRCALVSPRGISRWSCTTFTISGGIDLFSLIEAPLLMTGAPAARIAAINTELAALAKSPQPTLLHLARKRELGFGLLSTIVELSTWRVERDQLVLDAHRLMPVFSFIRQHLEQPLRIDSLAALAQLSAPRFHVVFRRCAGTPPHRYIQKLRMKRAQELLIGTDLAIGDIATRAGFQDPFFFSRSFAKACGTSPSAYRTRMAAGLM